MCYTEEEVLDPDYNWFIGIVDLQTLAFNLPESSCIDRITLLVNTDEGEAEIDIPLYKFGLYMIPIPKEFNYINFSVWIDDFRMRSWAFYDYQYNPDGILDSSDVIQIPDKCPY